MREWSGAMEASRSGTRRAFRVGRLGVIAGHLPLSQASVRAAFEARQFHLAFQPLLRAVDGAVVGCEALMRWTHPTQGEQAPGDFIPLLERSRLILEVGDWVLRDALNQVAAWEAGGAAGLCLSVNVAPLQVHAPDFPHQVARALDTARIAPERLTLEITQETLTTHPEHAGRQLARLARLGVQIHLDDFSSGPSALGNLKAQSITGIKLDRRFIAPFVASGGGTRSELHTIVGLARELGLKTVAEAVQTDAEVAAVWELGIDEVQGHLFCPALPVPAFTKYLRAQSAHKCPRGD